MKRFIENDLKYLADSKRAQNLARFFKTKKGEYGEGDKFLGLTVPQIRTAVRKYQSQATLNDALLLLRSPFHECRLASLLLMVQMYKNAEPTQQKKIFEAYLGNTKYINNWDLVDLSASNIVGAYLADKSKVILFKLAKSPDLWQRRIAVLATFYFINQGKTSYSYRIANALLADNDDLIHKAVGWMLRECGKRCSQAELKKYLISRVSKMSRTTFRYAIEKFPEKKRQYLLGLK